MPEIAQDSSDIDDDDASMPEGSYSSPREKRGGDILDGGSERTRRTRQRT
jgi:hypothetical protein